MMAARQCTCSPQYMSDLYYRAQITFLPWLVKTHQILSSLWCPIPLSWLLKLLNTMLHYTVQYFYFLFNFYNKTVNCILLSLSVLWEQVLWGAVHNLEGPFHIWLLKMLYPFEKRNELHVHYYGWTGLQWKGVLWNGFLNSLNCKDSAVVLIGC